MNVTVAMISIITRSTAASTYVCVLVT